MPAATTTYPNFKIFAPFSKVSEQDDGTIMVESLINDETPDDQGELVTYEAVEKASPDYMAFANVREMHNPMTAAGTMVSLTADPVLRKHTGVLHIVDPDAVKKVLAGVYKGTSLGGRKTAFGGLKKVAGKTVREVTGIYWNETSLADRPSRPTATLTLLKRSDAASAAEATSSDELAATPSDAPQQEVTDTPMATTPHDLDVPEDAAKTTQPGDLAKADAVTAPEAGTDLYLGPDGQPMAKAAETEEPAPEPPAEPAAPLAKSAVDDVMSLNDVIEGLAAYIEAEALEGDTADVAKLKPILASLQAAVAAESAEVGTPEDTAARQEEIAEDEAEETVAVLLVEPMYYAAVTGDLAKSAVALRKSALPADQAQRIQQLHDMSHAAGADCATAEAAPAEPALAKIAGVDPDVFLAKLSTYLESAIGPTVSPSDLEAVKAEILGVLGPVKEDLAKIAAQPVPGGPLRYAADDRRLLFDTGHPVESSEVADALAKASQIAGIDPHLREELGRLAAASEIAAARRQSA